MSMRRGLDRWLPGNADDRLARQATQPEGRANAMLPTGASDNVTMMAQRRLEWRAVAGLALVAGLAALLLYEGIETLQVDLILIGGILLSLAILALAWRPRAGVHEEDPA